MLSLARRRLGYFVLFFNAFIALTCFTDRANATSGAAPDYSLYQPYVSFRALGMGNAFCALADDESAIFYNPAGLARLPESNFNMGIGAILDSKAQKFESDIKGVSGTGSSKIDQYSTLLQENYGNHYSIRAPIVDVMWAKKNWGFAFIPFDLNIEMEIHQLAGAALDVVATQDSTIAIAHAWDLGWFGPQNQVSFGLTAKGIYRGYFNDQLLASDLALDSTIVRPQDAQEGMTADLDTGLLWTPHISKDSWWRYSKPTLGITGHNLIDEGFFSNYHLISPQSASNPPHLGREVDVGSKFDLPDWWVFRTRMMADIRDIGNQNWAFSKGYHLGAEFLWKIRSWWQGGWRVGINQGYFTAGFTGRAGIFNLDLVTYAEEVGTTNATKADRRYAAKASLDW
jgi:hypothetical protein